MPQLAVPAMQCCMLVPVTCQLSTDAVLRAPKQVEVATGLQEPSKGVAAWNGARTHHLDAHRLDVGSWIAAIDGDSMFSVWHPFTPQPKPAAFCTWSSGWRRLRGCLRGQPGTDGSPCTLCIWSATGQHKLLASALDDEPPHSLPACCILISAVHEPAVCRRPARVVTTVLMRRQGDITRRFLQRALQLAALCALLATFRAAILRMLGAGGQPLKAAAADLLPVKRPRSAAEPTWLKRFCGGHASHGGAPTTASLRLPLLSDALQVRTWPAAGEI